MRHIIFLNGIWPNLQTTPAKQITRSISCYQLKHWLSNYGIKSQVIDFCQLLTGQEIILLLEKFVSSETICIGVSTTYWPTDKTIPHSVKMALDYAKEKWPDLKIISGGARKTNSPDMFDKHFVGESENELLTWCQNKLKKSTLLNRPFDITRLTHRFDVTDCILPDEALPIELGRGCIFKCKFCSHQNLGKPKFTYQRGFSHIIDEMKYNHDMFGTRRYMFLDDTVNEDLDKIHNLSTLKDHLGFEIEWTGYLRADLVWAKPESVELLQSSGLQSCFFGIETFHGPAGKSIDKGWGAKHGKEYLPVLYELWGKKINMHINLIAGLPFETMGTLSESLNWCKSHDIGYHRFVPLTLYVEKDDEFASSEFTRNYSSHGYKNVNHESGYWETDFMNVNDARKFCEMSAKELSSINKISSWDVFSATNLGYQTSDVMSWDRRKFNTMVIPGRNRFKDAYLQKLNELTV